MSGPSISVAILGASGYGGGELVRLLDVHPEFEVAYLGAHTRAGSRLGDVHPHLIDPDRMLGPIDAGVVPEADLAFLALPHGSSVRPGLELAKRGMRVVDLGSDFRMDTGERYAAAYGSRHPAPESLPAWTYGLPELFDVRGSDLVASPGCYPTATLIGLAPLVRGGLVASTGIVVNALSGVSGAGRSLRSDLLFGAVDEGVRAYDVARHRHRPEIEMGLELGTQARAQVTFTPHLVPMQRGILATCTVPLAGAQSREDLLEGLEETYRDAVFVDVVDEAPQTRWVVGSNRAMVTAYVDEHTGQAVVLSAIDNLLKGAAGQAVQAANLMFGLPEAAGLPRAGWMP
ncbi:MAG TPA: N-acetyl-gamma-glutamyl-phosphate reductase [Actinobacteria bacterium]|nr:N-acetyl-gamma-glutamyl-phosphate reductase [bacterium BMS3Bbin01]HDK44922.1 N-acetyl-gamma-glutamyl-phosphate reductase [Actinomycetota bacterium]